MTQGIIKYMLRIAVSAVVLMVAGTTLLHSRADTTAVRKIGEPIYDMDEILDTLVIDGDTVNVTRTYLDDMPLKKKKLINDYSMIGIQGGAGVSLGYFNPSFEQSMRFSKPNLGIVFTHYCKMFGYMPYFGWQAGIYYTEQGYKFKQDESSGYIGSIMGAQEASIKTIDASLLSHFHIDFWKMKLIINAGLYAGYRIKIEHIGPNVADSLRFSFHPQEHRFDYGARASVGFGFNFDPIEIHLMANYMHSFESLYDPDFYSKYYYRYAYPINISVSLGLFVQLTRREGKSRKQLKAEALEYVKSAPEQRQFKINE